MAKRLTEEGRVAIAEFLRANMNGPASIYKFFSDIERRARSRPDHEPLSLELGREQTVTGNAESLPIDPDWITAE